MDEKKYFTFSMPSTGYYYTDDPAFTGVNPNASNGSWSDIPFRLSEKPLFRPSPRPKIEAPKTSEAAGSGFRFVPNPASEPKSPESKPEQQ